MRLQDYLTKHSVSVADFASQIGARGHATVYRYLSTNGDSKRIPDEDMMKRIHKATGGAVTANDFYNLPTARKPNGNNGASHV